MSKALELFTDTREHLALFETTDDLFQHFLLAKENNMAPAKLNAPIFLLWELTGACPQNCIYCYNQSPKKVNEMSSKRLFEIADQLLKKKIFSICLSGGEPLMCSSYLDLAEYIAAGGIKVGTVLSGWKVDKQLARRLSRCASTIQISLDGSNEEIHDAVRRRKGSFRDATNAIRLFVELGVPVHISFAIVKQNARDFEKVYDLCTELGVASLRTQKLAVAGRVKGHDSAICATKADYSLIEEFIEKIKQAKDKSLKIDYADPSSHIRFGKKLGMCVLATITANADVSLSPYLEIYFGNLRDEDFDTIWERMKQGFLDPGVQAVINGKINCDDGIITDTMYQKYIVQ